MKKTPFDYRRYIFLVQFIATSPNEESVCKLCDKWGIEPHIHYEFSYPIDSKWGVDLHLDYDATYARLATSVIEYHRQLRE